ncbi:dUTP diphosphatase [Nitratifractor salsuginis]|uniref:dUTPase n=1 Tax=Nitratifractor salsuginis (strain DSM 16511 / JCM 12458 / E9I37-1) TaxID=749222 RepID=E6WZ80_NITSE|nr:dUTP diphosphatase [Nitratifractor salsuginis]ADV46592.1 dUTPase [Nitratifractor salsuginis DSM 16511]
MLETMLRLQQQLNDETNGPGWEEGLTNRGKKIDWRRCIWLEAAELVESYPWKHWKNIDAAPDYDNIRIEAVDIWHFVMSEALRLNRLEGDGDISKLARRIAETESYCDFARGALKRPEDIYKQIATVESFVAALFAQAPIEELTARFFDVAALGELDLNTLYSLYVGKNILNRFRQDHGYKEGSYLKEWEGREDNVVMQEILAQNRGIGPEELYAKLEAAYPGAK